MFIALATGIMTLTLPDGTTQTVNLGTVVDVTAEIAPQFIYGADTPSQVTRTNNYFVRLHFNDNRFLDLQMGKQTGAGSLWMNTLAGANIAVTDITGNLA